jgi:hypothetical protein
MYRSSNRNMNRNRDRDRGEKREHKLKKIAIGEVKSH